MGVFKAVLKLGGCSHWQRTSYVWSQPKSWMSKTCPQILLNVLCLYFPLFLHKEIVKPRGYRAWTLGVKVNITGHKKDWCHIAPDKMLCVVDITCVVSWPQMYTLNLITRNQQTNPDWGTFDKMPKQHPSQSQGHERLRVCQRRKTRMGTTTKCHIGSWIASRKRKWTLVEELVNFKWSL